MKRCLITDRSRLPPGLPLAEFAASRHPDLVQLREKDLEARDLAALTQSLAARGLRVVVNTRVDVALACQAAGAHLPSNSPPPSLWRALAPPGFLFGVSCHSLEDAVRAEQEGASYVLLAPVFDPLSKAPSGPALGLEGLAAVCRAVRIPVWALGGITEDNAPACIAAGAAGVAGITLFL